jgi:ABC-type sugar transport system ATPase subunit
LTVAEILKLENVRRIYDRKTVLSIETLAFEKGSITAIVGPNGSGKTTLLETAAGLAKPEEGRVLFSGDDIYQSPRSLAEFRLKATLAFQRPVLFRGTVECNVSYPLKVRGLRGTRLKKAALEYLEFMGISALSDRRHNTLSGGEIQRVSLARALAAGSEILFLDEPTLSLEAEFHENFIEQIRKRAKAGAAVIFSTHDKILAEKLGERTITLICGQIH